MVISTKDKVYFIAIVVAVFSMFMLGRVTKQPEIIIEPNSSRVIDSLEFEINKMQDEKTHLNFVLKELGFRIDSLTSNNNVVSKRYRLDQKKRYENNQKMSLDSAIVARNILLDSAIESQRGTGETKGNSGN